MATTHYTNTSVASFEESPSRMKAPLWANDSAAEAYTGATTWIAMPPLSHKGEERHVYEPNANKAR